MNAPPRVTNHEFPPYTYVPGVTPHPLSAPNGHRCPGPDHHAIAALAENWRQSTSYLWGIDLFNAGCFWEAHEAWEHVWIDAKSDETSASHVDWVKGLIKLAAAGVKALEGKPEGVQRHARRSAELIGKWSEEGQVCGLLPTEVLNLCAAPSQNPELTIDRAYRQQRPLGWLAVSLS